MKASKFLTVFFVALVLVVLSGIGNLIFQKSASSLPVYTEVAHFRLIDTQGQVFDSTRLNNKVWVTAFFFSTCSGICPIMTKNLKSLQDVLSPSYPDVEFVSISVNPEQDNPQALAGYAQKYGADTKRWHFLTGTRGDISRIAVHGFKVGSVDEPIFHSAYFILVDRKGRIRGYYEGTQKQEVERLSRDLVQLYMTKSRW